MRVRYFFTWRMRYVFTWRMRYIFTWRMRYVHPEPWRFLLYSSLVCMTSWQTRTWLQSTFKSIQHIHKVNQKRELFSIEYRDIYSSSLINLDDYSDFLIQNPKAVWWRFDNHRQAGTPRIFAKANLQKAEQCFWCRPGYRGLPSAPWCWWCVQPWTAGGNHQ